MHYKVIIKEINKPNQVVLYEGYDKTVADQITELFLSVTLFTPHLFIKVLKTKEI